MVDNATTIAILKKDLRATVSVNLSVNFLKARVRRLLWWEVWMCLRVNFVVGQGKNAVAVGIVDEFKC